MTLHFGDNSSITTFNTIDASKLTGALPAISGASLTNLPVKVQEASSTGETSTSSTQNQTKVSLTVSTSSSTRVLLFFSFEHRHSDDDNNQSVRTTITNSVGGFIGGNPEFTNSGSSFSRVSDLLLDISSHSGNRVYSILFRSSNQNIRIKNAFLTAFAFTV